MAPSAERTVAYTEFASRDVKVRPIFSTINKQKNAEGIGAMKVNADDVAKAFKGLAIAASRAKDMAKEHGRDKLVGNLPRRQQDAIRQQLLDIESDIGTMLEIMTGK